MSNELINPFQSFFDDKGVALANGQIKVLENLSVNTLGTAFSDEALTVAQAVDPYVLDAAGRVTGNLRWLGKRTLELRDEKGSFVRTLDNVVSIVDGSTFPINAVSVAAMAADTKLIEGNVVETQSYLVDQLQGGARYIVTTSALSVDNYRVIDLAPTGLQAQLLDQELNNNFYVAGAVGDGAADDSTPVSRVLAIGGDIECANGIFRMTNLALTASARIFGDGTMKSVTFSSFNMLNVSGEDIVVKFDGVTIDHDSDNQTALLDTVSIRSTVTKTASGTAFLQFRNVTFKNGAQYNVEGVGDNSANQVVYSFGGCDWIGGLEGSATGPYLPAGVRITNGANCMVDDGYFDLNATPSVLGGRGGIFTESTLTTNLGYLSVSDTTFNRMGVSVGSTAETQIRGAINARNVVKLIAADNRIFSPQGAGILFGAEVVAAEVGENMIDALTGTNKLGGIIALPAAALAPGSDWSIQTNQLLSIAGIAIDLDGEGTTDVSRVKVSGNTINAPTSQAIRYHNIVDLTIDENQINMALVASVNAIEENTAGAAGLVKIEANEIINLAGTAVAIKAEVTLAATYVVDGNAIEAGTNGISIKGKTTIFITNNPLVEVTGTLIDFGTATNVVLDGNSYVGTAPSTFAINSGSVTSLVTGENFWTQYDASITSVASVAALPITSHYHLLTGTTAVTSLVLAADIAGFIVVIEGPIVSSVTMTDGASLRLGANRVLSAGDTLTLVNSGSNVWTEIAFSNN